MFDSPWHSGKGCEMKIGIVGCGYPCAFPGMAKEWKLGEFSDLSIDIY
jgi:hypothetical protein